MNTSTNQFIRFTVPAAADSSPVAFVTFAVKAGVAYLLTGVFFACVKSRPSSPELLIGFSELLSGPTEAACSDVAADGQSITTLGTAAASPGDFSNFELQPSFNFPEDLICNNFTATFTASEDGNRSLYIQVQNQGTDWTPENAVEIEGQFVLQTTNRG